jgi:hypothetical protein
VLVCGSIYIYGPPQVAIMAMYECLCASWMRRTGLNAAFHCMHFDPPRSHKWQLASAKFAPVLQPCDQEKNEQYPVTQSIHLSSYDTAARSSLVQDGFAARNQHSFDTAVHRRLCRRRNICRKASSHGQVSSESRERNASICSTLNSPSRPAYLSCSGPKSGRPH